MTAEILLLVTLFVCCAECGESETSGDVEARGKAKYALLSHLVIVLAAKIGLYKLVLGIGLILASMKLILVMAWALAISKYVPDAWTTYKETGHTNYQYQKFVENLKQTHGPGYSDWLVHFFYVAATKLFVLKIVYGIIFYVLLSKGWHFILWFVHYLKHSKHEEYIEHEPIYHDHDHGHDYHGYSAPYHGEKPYYGSQPYQGYESYQSYGYEKKDYETNKAKKVYDSDGSYSVNSPVVAGGKYL